MVAMFVLTARAQFTLYPATQAEVDAGTSTGVAVTPATLAARLAGLGVADVTNTVNGLTQSPSNMVAYDSLTVSNAGTGVKFTMTGAGISGGVVSNSTIRASDLGTSARSVAMEAQKPPLVFNFPYYASWGTNNTEDTVTGVAAGNVQTNIYATISEYVLLAMATNAVNDGLLALGYNWIDSGPNWCDSVRTASDDPKADPNRFPNGIGYTKGILNKMGFRLVLWAELGRTNSAGLLGSGTDWNHVHQDARFYSTNADMVRWDHDSFPVFPDNGDIAHRALNEAFLYALRTNNSSTLTWMHNNRGGGVGEWTNGYAPWMLQSVNYVQVTDPAPGLIADSAQWENNIRWIDVANRNKGDMRLGHKLSSIPIDFGWLLSGQYSGHNGRLIMSMLAMFQSPLCFRANMVAFKRYYDALTPPQTAPNPDFQTNIWMLAINQNDDQSPPWKQFTNGTIEVWAKTLKANPKIGTATAGSLWGDGTMAYMVINRGYASNVLGNTFSIPLKHLGIPTNSTSFAKFQNVWEYTNVVLNGTQSWSSSAETNTCSLWVMISPTNNMSVLGGIVNGQTGVTLNGNAPPNANTASGATAFAVGNNTTASGDRSVALGHFTTASALYAFAAGNTSVANAQGAIALGELATASGAQAFCASVSATASGISSVRLGGTGGTVAGNYSIGLGNQSWVPSGVTFATEINCGGGTPATNNTSGSFQVDAPSGIKLLGSVVTSDKGWLVKSNLPSAIPSLSNGDNYYWSSNGVGYIIAKDQSGTLSTNKVW